MPLTVVTNSSNPHAAQQNSSLPRIHQNQSQEILRTDEAPKLNLSQNLRLVQEYDIEPQRPGTKSTIKGGYSTGSFFNSKVSKKEDSLGVKPDQPIDIDYFKRNQVKDLSDTNFMGKVLDRAFPSQEKEDREMFKILQA